MTALKIALIADIHHGVDVGTKLGAAAMTLMRPFVDWVDHVQPDLVVELGDRINDLDRDTDIRWTKEVARVFDEVRAPCVHILGNHDVLRLDRRESEDALQTSFASHSRDVNGYHLVFWNSAVAFEDGGYHLPASDLEWLETDLAATGLPTLVFSHLPLDNGSMLGNFYFERLVPHGAHYFEGAAAREVIERSGKVIACLAGHAHWNQRHTIDGVHYITPSFADRIVHHPSVPHRRLRSSGHRRAPDRRSLRSRSGSASTADQAAGVSLAEPAPRLRAETAKDLEGHGGGALGRGQPRLDMSPVGHRTCL